MRVVVVHRDGLGRAHLARHLQREGAARDGDHPRPGVRGEAGEEGAQEADPDDRHRLPRLDLAAAEDVHGAAQRLARERLSRQRRPGGGPRRPRRPRRTRRSSCRRARPRGRPAPAPPRPSPSASTTPHPSCPSAPGSVGNCIHSGPAHGVRLEAQTPHPSRRTRTCPGPGSGSVGLFHPHLPRPGQDRGPHRPRRGERSRHCATWAIWGRPPARAVALSGSTGVARSAARSHSTSRSSPSSAPTRCFHSSTRSALAVSET